MMFRLWEQLETPGEFELLIHTHDALLMQCDDWEKWWPRVEPLTVVEWEGPYDTFSVPWSWDVGANWREVS